MTSKWIQSAPAVIAELISSPNLAKFAESIEGAIIALEFMMANFHLLIFPLQVSVYRSYPHLSKRNRQHVL